MPARTRSPSRAVPDAVGSGHVSESLSCRALPRRTRIHFGGARSGPAPRTLIAIGLGVGLIALACGGCGRRGALEPPGAATQERSASAQTPASARALPTSVGLGGGSTAPDPDAVRDGEELAVSATPAGGDGAPVTTSKGAKRGYTIPKGPFILDPIL